VTAPLSISVMVTPMLVPERWVPNTSAMPVTVDLVLHQFGGAHIAEAGGKSLGQPERPVGLTQQQRAGIRGDGTTVKTRHHMATFDGWKFEQTGATLCRHWGSYGFGKNRGGNTILPESAPQCI
jgi:hypothetical protein